MENFLGTRIIYQYDNGWIYEMYIKNNDTIDYRIHSGMVAGRWTKGQKAGIVKLTEGVYKVWWTEPTGTDVVLNFMMAEKRTHGVIFFPKWVKEHPEITVCFQNDFIDLMIESRDKYGTYPKVLVEEFSKIIFFEKVGMDNETIISQAPYEGIIHDIIEGKFKENYSHQMCDDSLHSLRIVK